MRDTLWNFLIGISKRGTLDFGESLTDCAIREVRGFRNGGCCARHSRDMDDEFGVAFSLFHLSDDKLGLTAVLSLNASS